MLSLQSTGKDQDEIVALLGIDGVDFNRTSSILAVSIAKTPDHDFDASELGVGLDLGTIHSTRRCKAIRTYDRPGT